MPFECQSVAPAISAIASCLSIIVFGISCWTAICGDGQTKYSEDVGKIITKTGFISAYVSLVCGVLVPCNLSYNALIFIGGFIGVGTSSIWLIVVLSLEVIHGP